LVLTAELFGQILKPGGTPLAQSFVPMTGTQRANQYWQDLANPVAILGSGVVAGTNQWTNATPSWGQGSAGFGKRFASAYGQHVLNVSFSDGLAAALHEDNRYFLSGETGFGKRLRYALTSTVLARRDDGSRRVSISRLVGFGAASAVSRTWRPPGERSASGAIGSFAIVLAGQAGFNLVREFIFH
jgi:hypothetical protein